MIGHDLWEKLGSDAEIVLAHPNTWGAARQQMFLRDAAVKAGLVSQERANQHLQFVEEAEASARFCLTTTDDSLLRTQFKVRRDPECGNAEC